MRRWRRVPPDRVVRGHDRRPDARPGAPLRAAVRALRRRALARGRGLARRPRRHGRASRARAPRDRVRRPWLRRVAPEPSALGVGRRASPRSAGGRVVRAHRAGERFAAPTARPERGRGAGRPRGPLLRRVHRARGGRRHVRPRDVPGRARARHRPHLSAGAGPARSFRPRAAGQLVAHRERPELRARRRGGEGRLLRRHAAHRADGLAPLTVPPLPADAGALHLRPARADAHGHARRLPRGECVRGAKLACVPRRASPWRGGGSLLRRAALAPDGHGRRRTASCRP